MNSAHVKTTPVDDGGCQVCDECDLPPGHTNPCDCHCDCLPTECFVIPLRDALPPMTYKRTEQ